MLQLICSLIYMNISHISVAMTFIFYTELMMIFTVNSVNRAFK